ncbi:MAG: ATP phosphoribosyltransferase [Lentisphaeraceae bacterium]|nr:ATP phosphoribosyltransferase [Lentisphaeraceae bacterium]
MLKIAVPNKGSLSEGAMQLIRNAGYKCRRSSKELFCADINNEVEFYFLRPTDIPTYVRSGIFHFGITGRDISQDSTFELTESMALGFGKARMMYISQGTHDFKGLSDFEGKTIACSYPDLIAKHLKENGINANIIELDGAVEISLHLGIADFAADVVETGTTIKLAGLKTIGEPILHSEAILVTNGDETLNIPSAKIFHQRLNGIITARKYLMLEYDIPTSQLEDACALCPGLESPTVSPLKDAKWNAVKVMVKSSDANNIMDKLSELGAKGIIITEIKNCRI